MHHACTWSRCQAGSPAGSESGSPTSIQVTSGSKLEFIGGSIRDLEKTRKQWRRGAGGPAEEAGKRSRRPRAAKPN
jgi:hypothetical protein